MKRQSVAISVLTILLSVSLAFAALPPGLAVAETGNEEATKTQYAVEAEAPAETWYAAEGEVPKEASDTAEGEISDPENASSQAPTGGEGLSEEAAPTQTNEGTSEDGGEASLNEADPTQQQEGATEENNETPAGADPAGDAQTEEIWTIASSLP